MTRNESAWLAVISACEGTVGDDGYRALFGWRPGNGKVFTSFADHPRQYFAYTQQDGTTVQTSAAGKYQATYTTWLDFIRERGPHDFSPASQDEFALWLTEVCGATGDINAGRLRAAIDKCGGRWASLPSARVPQPRRTYAFCEAAFLRAGGVLEGGRTEPERNAPLPAPPPGAPSNQSEEAHMGGLAAAGLIGQLLQTVVSVFAPAARAKVEEAAGKITDAAGAQVLADGLMGVLQQVTGLQDPVQATAAVTAPTDAGRAKLAAVEQQTVMRLDEFAGFLDRIAALEAQAAARTETSRANARAFATPESWSLRMRQVSFTQWGLGIAALAVAILTAVQMIVTRSGVPDPSLMVLLTAIVMGLVNTFRDQTGFSFGGTADSNATAIARDELAARRQS